MHRKLSLREIAAAWVCCGVLAAGAFLVNSGGGRDASATAAYAGAHIPDGAGRQPREAQAGDEPDDKPAGTIGMFANDAAPVAIGSAEKPTIAEPAHGPRSANRYCRYAALRQSGIRYSAAARLVAVAGSGARDAAQ